MNEHEAETLIQEAFRSHEQVVRGGLEGLIPAVRGRVARHRRARRVAAAGAVTLALLGVIAITPTLLSGGHRGTDRSTVSDPAITGWRWEGSLGAEISVPDHWAINDFGCHATDQPSVVRNPGPQFACYYAESATKEVAIISLPPPDQGPGAKLPERAVTIDGTPATRAEGRLPDGRYAGSITVPSRQLSVSVRTRDAATTARILDSLRLVDTEHIGCATQRPDRAAAGATKRSAEPFVPADATSIAVCYYVGDRLWASTSLTGDEAKILAAAINAAKPGRNPDPPAGTCSQPGPPIFDAMLIVRAQDETSTVWVTFSSCTGRGLDNGVRDAQLTMSTLRLIMAPLHVGYATHGLVD